MAFNLRHQIKCLRTLRRKNKQRFNVNKLKCLQDAEDTLQKPITEARVMFEEKLICDFPYHYRVYRYIWSVTQSKSMPQVLYFGTQQGNNDAENAR